MKKISLVLAAVLFISIALVAIQMRVGNTFINSGSTASVSSASTISFNYLVVGGGGAGGQSGPELNAGGGGGGQVLTGTDSAITSGTAYAITVGAGGAPGSGGYSGATGGSGGSSLFNSHIAAGGTGGTGTEPSGSNGGAGGALNSGGVSGGVSGGGGGGGGGSSANGTAGTNTVVDGGNGGRGTDSSLSGALTEYGGGGGGEPNGTATGGGAMGWSAGVAQPNGTQNTGGGGGGSSPYYRGGNVKGGSGVVIISALTGIVINASTAGGTYTTSGGSDVWTFTSSGTWTPAFSGSSTTSTTQAAAYETARNTSVQSSSASATTNTAPSSVAVGPDPSIPTFAGAPADQSFINAALSNAGMSLTSPTAVTTVYVAPPTSYTPAGTSQLGSGTQSDPYRNLIAIVHNATPGEHIYLEPGIYLMYSMAQAFNVQNWNHTAYETLLNPTTSGTQASPIVISTDPSVLSWPAGNVATLDFQMQIPDRGARTMAISLSDWWDFENIEVRNALDRVFWVGGSHDLIYHNDLHHIELTGTQDNVGIVDIMRRTGGNYNDFIIGNNIHDYNMYNSSGAPMPYTGDTNNVGCTYSEPDSWYISYHALTSSSVSNINSLGMSQIAPYLAPPDSNVYFYANALHDCMRGIGTKIPVIGPWYLLSNLIYNVQTGIKFTMSGTASTPSLVRNNIIYNGGARQLQTGIQVGGPMTDRILGNTDNVSVTNNTVIDASNQATWHHGGFNDVINNNVFVTSGSGIAHNIHGYGGSSYTGVNTLGNPFGMAQYPSIVGEFLFPVVGNPYYAYMPNFLQDETGWEAINFSDNLYTSTPTISFPGTPSIPAVASLNGTNIDHNATVMSWSSLIPLFNNAAANDYRAGASPGVLATIGSQIPITATAVTTCTFFTYSSWNICQSNGTQTRTVTSASPQGCAGGSPIFSQSCTYTPPAVSSPSSGNYSSGIPTTTSPPTPSSSGGGGTGSSSGTTQPITPSSTPIFQTTLFPGERSTEVTALQQELITLGLLSSGYNTGYYGPLTTRAVQMFQASHGIVSSGTPFTTGYGSVGPMTLAQINTLPAITAPVNTTPAASVTSPEPFPGEFFLGNSGARVRALQQELITLGLLSSGYNTGYYGPLTTRAVQMFQASHGIVSSGTPFTTGYGSVGPMTWKELQAIGR